MTETNVVILNWNAADDTLRCLRTIEQWAEITPRIWVVDNDSAEDDVSVLENGLPEGCLIRSQVNLGFSGGSNLGVRRAIENNDSPVLLLNNDVRIAEVAVLALLETLRSRAECGIAGPVLYQSDGDGQRVLSAGSRNPVLFRFPAITDPPPDDEYPVAYVSGAAALIRADVFRQVGLFDEQYFFATEMADLCRRAAKAGYSCFVNSRAKAHHDVERASGLRETLYVYYVVRNRFRYILKFHPLLAPALIGFWSLYGLEQAWRLNRQGRRATAAAIRMGVVDGLRRRFGGCNQRVIDQCSRYEEGTAAL